MARSMYGAVEGVDMSPAQEDYEKLRRMWVTVTAAAIATTLWHAIIDYQIGLYGETSNEMGFFQGMFSAMHGVLYAWWAVTVAMAYNGSRTAHAAALVITVIWAALGNGAVALIAAPPPSAAFPFQDMAHLSSLVFGAGSIYLTVQIFRRLPGRSGRKLPMVSVVVMLAFMAIGTPLTLANL